MKHDNSLPQQLADDHELRPLARTGAREVTAEEIAAISGGFDTRGISNVGGIGDRDLVN